MTSTITALSPIAQSGSAATAVGWFVVVLIWGVAFCVGMISGIQIGGPLAGTHTDSTSSTQFARAGRDGAILALIVTPAVGVIYWLMVPTLPIAIATLVGGGLIALIIGFVAFAITPSRR